MKNYIIGLVVVILVGVGIYFLVPNLSKKAEVMPGENTTTNTPPGEQGGTVQTVRGPQSVIGKSVGGRDIVAYHFGTSSTEVLFIGGIHGGYEWNTSLVAFELVDYLKNYPEIIPSNVSVTVIPVLNPDGLSKVVATTTRFIASEVNKSETVQVSGRFNGNTVDLNRNFDCDWQPSAKWQDKTVSGGTAAFSEPESQAIKAYVESHRPAGVLVWYSAAGGVFASNCHNGVSSSTRALTNGYAKASGYPAFETFNFYEITGDMVNWFAKQNIPAVSVLLTNHTDTEWSMNLKGIKAFLQFFTR